MQRPWLVLMLVLVPAVAYAKPKVALATFSGDTKDHARSAVADVIDGDLAVVDEREAHKKLSENQLARLSRTLDVDAVVHGKVSSEGDGKVLRVSLFVHGKKSGTFYVPYTSLTSKKFKRTVHDRLIAKLEPPVAKAKVAKSDDDDDADAKPAKKKRVAARDDSDADNDNDNDDAPSVAKSVPLAAQGAPRLDRAAALVEAGMSVSSRVLTYSSRTFDQAPPSYHNAGVPGARIAGELYPLALVAPNSSASGIGIAGSYDKTMGLSVAAPASLDTPANKLDVNQHAWSVGGRYRYGWVTFAADYGHHAFEVNRAQGTIDIPDVDYAGFEPGLDVRVPLGTKFALRAGGRAMLLKSAGPIQSNDSYGRAHISGGHAMVGLDVAVGQRVALRLAGEAMILKMTFYGTGAETTSRDMDPTTVDVGGATDKYFGGSATLAVFY